LLGLAVVTDPASAEVVWLPAGVLEDLSVVERVRAVLDRRGVAAHPAKPILRALLALDGDRDLPKVVLDTTLAAYLLDPAETRYSIADVLARYTDWQLPDEDSTPSDQL